MNELQGTKKPVGNLYRVIRLFTDISSDVIAVCIKIVC